MNEETQTLEKVIKKYIDIVLEDSKSNFKALADGQQILERKIDVLADDMKIVKQDAEVLKEDMDFVKGEVVEIRKRFKEVDADLDKKAEKAVISDHETRIIKLENTALAKA